MTNTQTIKSTSDSFFLAWAPDGVQLALSSNPNEVRIWNRNSGTITHVLTGHTGYGVRSAAWSPDGTRLATGGQDGTIRIWDPSTATTIKSLTVPPNQTTTQLVALAWSPDGTRLAAASYGGDVLIWDPTGGTITRTLTHTNTVATVAWSPDGLRLATGDYDTTIRIWNPANGEAQQLGAGSGPGWSPDGTQLATFRSGEHEEQAVVLWDPTNGQQKRTVPFPKRVWYGAWSPDRTRLATIGDDEVDILYTTSLTTIHIIPKGLGTWSALAWSPDGKRLALQGNHTITIWK